MTRSDLPQRVVTGEAIANGGSNYTAQTLLNEPMTGSEYVLKSTLNGGAAATLLVKQRGAWPLGQSLPPGCTAQTTCTSQPLALVGGGVTSAGDSATITLTLSPPGNLNLCAAGGCSVSVSQNPLLQSTQAGLAGTGMSCTGSPVTLTSTYSLISTSSGGDAFEPNPAMLKTGAHWDVFNKTGNNIVVCSDGSHTIQKLGTNGMAGTIAHNSAAGFTVINSTTIVQIDVAQ